MYWPQTFERYCILLQKTKKCCYFFTFYYKILSSTAVSNIDNKSAY